MDARRCNWINQVGIQCGMPFDHACGHSNGMLTTPRDVWHEFIGEAITQPSVVAQLQVERFGNVWTDKSIVKRCLWSGASSRCIYEFGHTLPHKEDIANAR